MFLETHFHPSLGPRIPNRIRHLLRAINIVIYKNVGLIILDFGTAMCQQIVVVEVIKIQFDQPKLLMSNFYRYEQNCFMSASLCPVNTDRKNGV